MLKRFLSYYKPHKKLFILDMLASLAVALIGIRSPRFLSVPSLINILSLSAAGLPIALGIAGCIILTGTDLSAGRIVGLTAFVSASLLHAVSYPIKCFPHLPPCLFGLSC